MDSDYGMMLLGKQVFVVGVLGLAVVNRFVVAPAFRRSATGGLRRRALAVVRTEAAFGVIVVGAAVLLGTTPPARPPTDIFLSPELVSGLADQQQTISGDRDGWELVVARRSSTTHRFLVRGPASQAADTQLALAGPGGNPSRQLSLQPTAEGAAGEGLVLTRDGHWTASLPLSGRDAVQFRFDVRAGYVLPHELRARSAWDRAVAESEDGLRSARMIDVLTDGLSVMLFAHHDLAAPDRERLKILGGREMVSVGKQRFLREPAGEWEVHQMSFGFRWPDYAFLDRVMGITFAGEATQAGREMIVLAGYDPEARVTYEIWVSRDDGLIHRLVMGLPGHYMINAYYDINAELSIEEPK